MATRCVQLGQLLDLVVEGSISYTAPVAAAAPQQGGDEPQDRDTDDAPGPEDEFQDHDIDDAPGPEDEPQDRDTDDASCSEDEPQDHDTYDAAGSEDEPQDHDTYDAAGSEDELEDRDIDDASGSEDASEFDDTEDNDYEDGEIDGSYGHDSFGYEPYTSGASTSYIEHYEQEAHTTYAIPGVPDDIIGNIEEAAFAYNGVALWDHLPYHNDNYHDFDYEEDQGWADVIYWGDGIPYDEESLARPTQPESTQELQIGNGSLNRDEPHEDETANQSADAAEQSSSEAPSAVSKSDSEISPVSLLVHKKTIDTTKTVATTSEGLRERAMGLLPTLHGYGSNQTDDDARSDSSGASVSGEDQSEEDDETEGTDEPLYNPFSLIHWNSAPLPQPAVFYSPVVLMPLPPFPTFPQPLGVVPSLSMATGAHIQSVLPVLTEGEERTFRMFLEGINGQRGDTRASWYMDGADEDNEDGESKEDNWLVEGPSEESPRKNLKRHRSPDDCKEDERRPSQVLRTH